MVVEPDVLFDNPCLLSDAQAEIWEIGNVMTENPLSQKKKLKSTKQNTVKCSQMLYKAMHEGRNPSFCTECMKFIFFLDN
jgi:hypothetical protein